MEYSYAVHLCISGASYSLRYHDENKIVIICTRIYIQYGYAPPSGWIRPAGEETAGLVSYVVQLMCQRRYVQFDVYFCMLHNDVA